MSHTPWTPLPLEDIGEDAAGMAVTGRFGSECKFYHDRCQAASGIVWERLRGDACVVHTA